MEKLKEEVSRLSYELRVSQEDASALKARVAELKQQRDELEAIVTASASAPSTSNTATTSSSSGAGAGAGYPAPREKGFREAVAELEKEPIKDFERKALNCLVKRYLVENGFRLAAMTLSDEAEGQDLDDLKDVGLTGSALADLHVLQRYWRKRPLKTTSELDAELQATNLEKDKYLQQIDMIKKGAEQRANELEAENAVLRERLDAHSRELTVLRTDLRAAKEENEYLVKNAGKMVKVEPTEEELAAEAAKAAKAAKDAGGSGFAKGVDGEAAAAADAQAASSRRRQLARIVSDTAAFEQAELARRITEMLLRDDVVSIVAASLPNIVPHVLLNKREELVPVILSVIRQHDSPDVRDSLMNQLFNLIKKPDEGQRMTIMDGCVALARAIGPVRTETELLPQCWEQVTHKHPERRVLVADSCGALAAYVRSDLRGSLLLSILQQLMDDKSALVRAAVARNLGTLVISISDEGKYSLVEDLAVRLLFDSAPQVTSATREYLLPRLAEWANEISSLWSMLFPTLLRHLDVLVSSNVGFSPFGDSSSSSVQRAMSLLSATASLIPQLHAAVMLSAAKPGQLQQGKFGPPDDDELMELQGVFDRAVEGGGGGGGSGAGFASASAAASASDASSASAAGGALPALDWLACGLVPRLIAVAARIDPSLEAATLAMREVFKSICMAFGSPFTRLIVRPQFIKIFEGSPHSRLELAAAAASGKAGGAKADVVDDAGLLGGDHNIRADDEKTRLLPLYVSSVLSTFLAEDADFAKALPELISAMSPEDRSGWGAKHLPQLGHCLEALGSGDDAAQHAILNVFRDLQLHHSPDVRAAVCALLTIFVRVLGREDIGRRVVPSLVTLSADSEAAVRLLAIPAFAAVLQRVQAQDAALLEKIKTQFEGYLLDVPKTPRDVVIAVVKAFAHTAGSVDNKFRDHLIAPKLHEIARRNADDQSASRKVELGGYLYEAFRSFNGCSVGPETASQHIIPALRILVNDIGALGATERANLKSMLSDLEGALAANAVDSSKEVKTRSIFGKFGTAMGLGAAVDDHHQGSSGSGAGAGAGSGGSRDNSKRASMAPPASSEVPTMSMDDVASKPDDHAPEKKPAPAPPPKRDNTSGNKDNKEKSEGGRFSLGGAMRKMGL